MRQFLIDMALQSGLTDTWAHVIVTIVLLILLLLGVWVVWHIFRTWLRRFILSITEKTKTDLDDLLLNTRVLSAIGHLVPALIFNFFAPLVFADYPVLLPVAIGITDIFIIYVLTEIISSLLNAAGRLIQRMERFRDKPIASFIQLAKIIVYAVAAIFAISIAIDKEPLYLLSGLGAMAAILLLVFKDSILGFVASIQLSANDMVRVGDWVTVKKYGADGDVIEINLTTIKVQNFDKTITTIPPYAFISDSFTNWRGMQASSGRRIKRAIYIKMRSIRFVDAELKQRLQKIQLLREYIAMRQAEIDADNQRRSVDLESPVNGRRMTNVGLFRKYIETYLQNHPQINREMTCMVRQLAPMEYGLPLEIYAFSKIKAWVEYEAIIADIFDHLLAIVGQFDLEVFERPAGTDLNRT